MELCIKSPLFCFILFIGLSDKIFSENLENGGWLVFL